MDKLTERIAALEERLRALKARQTHSAARARTIQGRRERKEDTRRKILAGAWVMSQVERGELSRESLQRSLDRFLTRADDRALFDLPAAQGHIRGDGDAAAPVQPVAPDPPLHGGAHPGRGRG